MPRPLPSTHFALYNLPFIRRYAVRLTEKTSLHKRHDDDDDNNNNNNNNSILYLLTCKLNNPKANYQVGTRKKEKEMRIIMTMMMMMMMMIH
jgi:hypothetical protein